MTNLLRFTVNFRKPYGQRQCILRVVILSWYHVSLCRQQHPLYSAFFSKFHSSSRPTNKNLTDSHAKFKQLYRSNVSELDTCSYQLFFLFMTDTATSQKYPFLPESPCIVCQVWEKEWSKRSQEIQTLYHIYISQYSTVLYDTSVVPKVYVYARPPCCYALGNYGASCQGVPLNYEYWWVIYVRVRRSCWQT